MSQAIFLILLFSCAEKELPSSSRGDTADPEGPVDTVDCSDQWYEGEDGVWYDPIACVAWSPASQALTWYEAVSASEADSGGCDTNCDVDPENDYCANLNLGGIGHWRVPRISEIEDLATRQPPFDSIMHDLWSIDSDSMDNLAWTANIDQPGMSVLLEKNSEANVRCIAD